MSFELARRSYCLALLAILVSVNSAVGAPPKANTNSQTVVDVVQLKSGKSLRGALAWREPNGSLTMTVSREWLRSDNPQLFPEVLRENLQKRLAAWTETRNRTEECLKTGSLQPELKFFLKQEKERLDQLIANPMAADPAFLWIDLPKEKIIRLNQAPNEQMKIAVFSWNEAMSQVETRSSSSLEKELKTKKVKLDGPTPEIFDWLAPRPQNDNEWAARKALVEYTLVKPFDFQGSAGTFIRTGEGQPINLAEILPKILTSQIGSLLKDLNLDGPVKQQDQKAWLPPLIRQVEMEKRHGFRVTQLEVDAATFRATIDSRFVAEISTGNWKTIWQFRQTEDGTKPRPAAEARIEQDPQLKTATDALKSLGIGDAATLQQAIRFGAATMAAQNAAEAAFTEYRERYSRQLESPPLRISTD